MCTIRPMWIFSIPVDLQKIIPYGWFCIILDSILRIFNTFNNDKTLIKSYERKVNNISGIILQKIYHTLNIKVFFGIDGSIKKHLTSIKSFSYTKSGKSGNVL